MSDWKLGVQVRGRLFVFFLLMHGCYKYKIINVKIVKLTKMLVFKFALLSRRQTYSASSYDPLCIFFTAVLFSSLLSACDRPHSPCGYECSRLLLRLVMWPCYAFSSWFRLGLTSHLYSFCGAVMALFYLVTIQPKSCIWFLLSGQPASKQVLEKLVRLGCSFRVLLIRS